MRQRAVGVVHTEGAARATLLPIRAEHEVVDNELALAVEKIRERHFPARPVENVILLDFDPRELPPFDAERILLTRELFFFLQKFLASGSPLGLRYDFRMLWHCFATGHRDSPLFDSSQRFRLRAFPSTLS